MRCLVTGMVRNVPSSMLRHHDKTGPAALLLHCGEESSRVDLRLCMRHGVGEEVDIHLREERRCGRSW